MERILQKTIKNKTMKTIKITNKSAITIANALNVYKEFLKNNLDEELVTQEVYMVEDLIADLKTKL